MIEITDKRLDIFFDRFQHKKIIVMGDVMLDRYVEGTVSRISPEAPVPVIDVTTEYTRLGGAANVAYNLHTLGAIPILIVVIGHDWAGEMLINLMNELNFSTEHLLRDETRPTVVKTRLIANDQHVVRADRESREKISADMIDSVVDMVSQNLSQADAIIMQDYNKGLLTCEIISKVINIAINSEKIVTVDPKFDNFFKYKSVDLFKPNRKEVEAALGTRINSIQDLRTACKKLIDRLKCNAVLVTLGEQGMGLCDYRRDFTHVPTKARKVHDVSGAGDTVISTLTLALACGAELKEAITLANYAAGIVCGEVGVVPITIEKLRQAIQNYG